MKAFKVIGAGSVLMLGIALSTSAFATSITPAGAFTATGATTLTKGIISLSCTSTFTGTVNADGTATVSAATFTGPALCSLVKANSLPWTITANSSTAGTVSGVSVTTSILGSCGPSDLPATWSNANSSLGFTNASLSGGCTVSGTLDTTPQLTLQ